MDVVIGPCKARMASVMMNFVRPARPDDPKRNGLKMKIRDSIERKLTEALEPTRLSVLDQSAEHAGHMGHPGHGTGETHFQVDVVSRAFVGKSKVERNRMVYALLAEEIAGGVHALSMSTSTPDEAG